MVDFFKTELNLWNVFNGEQQTQKPQSNNVNFLPLLTLPGSATTTRMKVKTFSFEAISLFTSSTANY